MKLTGRLIAAARALAGVSRDDFAGAAGLSKEAYTRLERKGAAWLTTADDIASISRSLAHFGILVVEERDGLGAGVRLKFTRQDVKQIMRLEGEGGATGADDNP
jgi:transcriptional regulator with XRE-family HTH domain